MQQATVITRPAQPGPYSTRAQHLDNLAQAIVDRYESGRMPLDEMWRRASRLLGQVHNLDDQARYSPGPYAHTARLLNSAAYTADNLCFWAAKGGYSLMPQYPGAVA